MGFSCVPRLFEAPDLPLVAPRKKVVDLSRLRVGLFLQSFKRHRATLLKSFPRLSLALVYLFTLIYLFPHSLSLPP